jgi:hypothetical protein
MGSTVEWLVNGGCKRTWKEAVVAQLIHCTGIYMDRLRIITKYLSD